MMKFLILLSISLTAAGCAHTYTYEATDDYRESYNVVQKIFGQLYITSGLNSSVIKNLPPGFHKKENFLDEGEFSKPWATIAVHRYRSNFQCFDEERDLESIIYAMLSEDILPTSDVKVRLFFVPDKQFEVTTKSPNNEEFSFYFPVNLCDRGPAMTALDNASARLVHEMYHVEIERGRTRPFNKQTEEENGYLLEFCNRVTSPSKSVLSREYFDIDYEAERTQMIDFSRNRVQRLSNLGRLDAMQSIHKVFSEGASVQEYCVSRIQEINLGLLSNR